MAIGRTPVLADQKHQFLAISLSIGYSQHGDFPPENRAERQTDRQGEGQRGREMKAMAFL